MSAPTFAVGDRVIVSWMGEHVVAEVVEADAKGGYRRSPGHDRLYRVSITGANGAPFYYESEMSAVSGVER